MAVQPEKTLEITKPIPASCKKKVCRGPDALKDVNLVFLIERLRELEAEGVIGRLTKDHYGFGLMGSANELMPSIREVAQEPTVLHDMLSMATSAPR